MIIKQSSWHYRLWNFSVTIFNEWGASKRTTLCSYVNQIALLPLKILAVIVALLIGGTAYFMVFAITNVGRILIGRYPTNLDLDDYEIYPGLPIGNFRLYPWHVLATVVLGFVSYWCLCFWLTKLGSLMTLGCVFASLALIVLVWKKSNLLPLVKAWFKAKKDGVCPLISFE